MDAAVECTHCRVVMTSWSAPGSAIRYYQCPFCQRTHSSLYGEVFRRRAGARFVEAPVRATAPRQIPMATAEDIRWARVRSNAARWFARLEAEGRRKGERVAAGAEPQPGGRRPAAALPRAADVPEVDPADVVLLAAAPRRR